MGDRKVVGRAIHMPGLFGILGGNAEPLEAALRAMSPTERDQVWLVQSKLAADEEASDLIRAIARATLRAVDRVEKLSTADIFDQPLLEQLPKGTKQDE